MKQILTWEEKGFSCLEDWELPVLLVDVQLNFLFTNQAFREEHPVLMAQGSLIRLFSERIRQKIEVQTMLGNVFAWNGKLGAREWKFLFLPCFSPAGEYCYTQVSVAEQNNLRFRVQKLPEDFLLAAMEELRPSVQAIHKSLDRLEKMHLDPDVQEQCSKLRDYALRIQYVTQHVHEIDRLPAMPVQTPAACCEVFQFLRNFCSQFPIVHFSEDQTGVVQIPVYYEAFGEILIDCCAYLISGQSRDSGIRVAVKPGVKTAKIVLSAKNVPEQVFAQQDFRELFESPAALRLSIRRAKMIADQYEATIKTEYDRYAEKLSVILTFPTFASELWDETEMTFRAPEILIRPELKSELDYLGLLLREKVADEN